MATKHQTAYQKKPAGKPGKYHPARPPWERTGETRQGQADQWVRSFANQVLGSPEPAYPEVAGAEPGGVASLGKVDQNPRFGFGKGFSDQDQMEIKRLRAELNRLRSVSRRRQQHYEQMNQTEEERKRVEEEEERLKKERKTAKPRFESLDWFKNVGRKTRGLVLGFAKQRKKAEFKPGGFRG